MSSKQDIHRFSFSSQLQPVVNREVGVELVTRGFRVQFARLWSGIQWGIVSGKSMTFPPRKK